MVEIISKLTPEWLNKSPIEHVVNFVDRLNDFEFKQLTPSTRRSYIAIYLDLEHYIDQLSFQDKIETRKYVESHLKIFNWRDIEITF